MTTLRNGSAQDAPPRVVITGLGGLTCLALSWEENWQKMLAGHSGIATITRFDTSELRTHFAGELKGFDPTDYMDRKEARRLDPYIQYALVGAQEAMRDAALSMQDEDPRRVGVIIGSAAGGLSTFYENAQTLDKRGSRRVSPFFLTSLLVDSAAGRVAIEYGMRGPNHAVVSACASGTSAVGEAFETIRRGDADVMLAGGSEAPLLLLTMSGFDVMNALSQRNDDPAGASRPFDTGRDGFVMSEGCQVLTLESLEHAQARGARIYAEVVGYGSSADAHHMAAPHPDATGAIEAMQAALHKAAAYGIQPADVDYINAHGTGTPLNDVGETLAIKTVLGEHAYRTRVSSTKSMIGHMMGASGAFEAAVCAKVIQSGIIPPTINLHDPDPLCDLDYTPLIAQEADVRVTMSNSFGLGGHNACLMLRRYEG